MFPCSLDGKVIYMHPWVYSLCAVVCAQTDGHDITTLSLKYIITLAKGAMCKRGRKSCL